MGKESQVEIPEGSGNLYRYEYVDGQTLYRGPVGDAPALSEEFFLLALSELAENNKLEPWRGGYRNDQYTIGLFENMEQLTSSEVGKNMGLDEMTSYPPSGYSVKDMIWVAGWDYSKHHRKHNRVKVITTSDSKHLLSSALYNKAVRLSGKNKRILVGTEDPMTPVLFESVNGRVAVVAPLTMDEEEWDELLDPTEASRSLK